LYLLLDGIANPIVVDGGGLSNWRDELKNIFVDYSVRGNLTCRIAAKKFAFINIIILESTILFSKCNFL